MRNECRTALKQLFVYEIIYTITSVLICDHEAWMHEQSQCLAIFFFPFCVLAHLALDPCSVIGAQHN